MIVSPNLLMDNSFRFGVKANIALVSYKHSGCLFELSL